MEPEKIHYHVHNEFHMLRHFEGVEEAKRNRLLQAGYTNDQIEQELRIPGSKFFSTFAHNIEELLHIIFIHPYQQSTGMNGNLIIASKLPEHQYPSGIGTKGVVAKSELSSEDRASVFYENNRNYSLAHLEVDRLPITNQCTLILKPLDEGYQFISAFSGEAAMPIPDKRMTEELYQTCVAFWEGHVFLVEEAKHS